MPRKRAKLRCPICKKPVKLSDPDSPFCSERCRLLDFGKWASGDYAIPSQVPDIEEEIALADLPHRPVTKDEIE